MSWNIGSLMERRQCLLDLLVQHSPHVVMLQEVQLTHGELAGFSASARSLGYLLTYDADITLCTLWRRGLNLAPLKKPSENTGLDTPYCLRHRCRDFALELKGNSYSPSGCRILLRNLHAPSGTGPKQAERRKLFDKFVNEQVGHLSVILGDWNDRPPLVPDTLHLAPEEPTFRKSHLDPLHFAP